jgi:hypothetical protein
MKKPVLIFTVLFNLLLLLHSDMSIAQITLEHSYSHSNVYVTQISSTDWNYYTQDDSALSIYDINHSLLKSIIIPPMKSGLVQYPYGVVSYVSTNLFNIDSYYEYAFYNTNTNQLYIFNELGTQLFSLDSVGNAYGNVNNNVNADNHIPFECFNSSAGIKMIVNRMYEVASQYIKYMAGNVYSLGGNYVTAIKPINTNGNNELPYPNPSSSFIHLTYNLPIGTEQAEMVITNISGQILKTYTLGTAFNDVLADTKDYSPGKYLYYIHSGNYVSPTSKFIVSR